MTLADRARLRLGVWPIPAGVMIETRSIRYGSLFLRQWHEAHNGMRGDRYRITRGISGDVVLECYVENGENHVQRAVRGAVR